MIAVLSSDMDGSHGQRIARCASVPESGVRAKQMAGGSWDWAQSHRYMAIEVHYGA
jgi:hypothetical protein